jgi:hypothetical protein
MFGATLQAALTLVVAAALATYVQIRAQHSPLRIPLLALLIALITWSGGVIWRFAAGDADSAFAGIVVAWVGIATVPPLWLLMAARYARLRALERRPILALAAFVPALFTIAALASNPYHHLFFRSFEARARPGFGPLYYVYLAYAYPMVLAGIGLFLLSARRMWSKTAWQRTALLACAALLPTVVSLFFVFDLLPIFYDPTPAALVCSLGLLTFGV